MSSSAKMFDGSEVARISVEPARLTGTTVCLSATSSRDQGDDLGVDLKVVEIDRRHAVLLRDEVGQLPLVHEAEFGDLGAETASLGARLIARLSELVLGQQVLSDEKLTDPLVHR